MSDIDTTLKTPIHPTQIYSALIFAGIFIFMYFFAQKKFTKTGQLFTIYLMMASLERFSIDFLRADRTILDNLPNMSVDQTIAIIIFIISAILFCTATLRKNKKINGSI